MSLRIALAGNPNTGKTTLFNTLTGSNQYVGNWPGVTVEKKEGKLRGHKDVTIGDTPGIYSLSPYTLEEVVARNYLILEKPDAVINIVDGTNLERNLYLTTQLIETGIPVLMAVNMMDIVEKNGDTINLDQLGKNLGCKAVAISALRGEGINEAVEAAIELAKAGKASKRAHHFDATLENAIGKTEDMIATIVPEAERRFFAIKMLEGDTKLDEMYKGLPSVADQTKELETSYDDDIESIFVAARYEYISSIIDKCLTKKNQTKMSTSDKIDRVITHRVWALPIFAGIMFLVYFFAVTTIGTIVTDWTNDTLFGTWIQPAVQALMENAGAAEWLVSLVVDGIIGGLAAPIGFAPQMALVFLCLSILEDIGYMARVAFIMDRIFRHFGLSGKSFISFLIASGCGVPAIMSTRTIENEKDRRMTMMTTTFIPCGAKLPVIATIAGYIMGGAWWAAPLMYFAGIIIVILSCIILKKTNMFDGEPAPFVMELPQYHVPTVRNIALHVWERVWAFLKKAGTILFLCCVVMWFLATFGVQDGVFGLVDTDYCFLASIGGAIAWIFKPLGFGTWQAVASSLSGFVAKEGIVSTMGVLAGLGEIEGYAASMHAGFAAFFPTTISAVAFMFFNLFDSPCLAAISTTAKEINSRKFFWFAILFQNVASYCVTLIIYQFGALATGVKGFNGGTVAAIIVLLVIIYLVARRSPAKKRAMAAARAGA